MPAPPMPAELSGGLALPLQYVERSGPRPRIAILLHLYYAELGPELWTHLKRFPGPADLYVTTNTKQKRDALAEHFRDWSMGRLEIRVVPNRGRDVAPRIVGLADVLGSYDLCLHVHGKRSLHWANGEAWRRYLLGTLLGPAMVSGVVEAFRRCPRLGLVMPRNWSHILSSIGWGYDLERARALARRMGFQIDERDLLEFPAGSMFWSRAGALKPLLDLNLSVKEFEREDGLEHGSLAHAIERLMLHICETAGFDWLRFAADEPAPAHFEAATSPCELDAIVARHRLRLTDEALNPPPSGAADRLRLRFAPDPDSRPRVTLLLGAGRLTPQGDPGGAAALLGRLTFVTDGAVRIRIAAPASVCPMLPPDLGKAAFVALDPAGYAPTLALSSSDVILATCWPGALAALGLRDQQAAVHGTAPPKVWFLPPPFPPGEHEREAIASRADAVLILAAPWSEPGPAACETMRIPPIWSPLLPLPRGGARHARSPLLLVDWQAEGQTDVRATVLEALSRCGRLPIAALGDGGPIVLPDGRTLARRGRPTGVEWFRCLSSATIGLAPPWNGRPTRAGYEMSAFGLCMIDATNWPEDAAGLCRRIDQAAAAPPRPVASWDAIPAPFAPATVLDRLAADLAERAIGPAGTVRHPEPRPIAATAPPP